jgi:hypothetical protein
MRTYALLRKRSILILESIDLLLDMLNIIQEQYSECGDIEYSYGDYITEKLTYEQELNNLINKQKQ